MMNVYKRRYATESFGVDHTNPLKRGISLISSEWNEEDEVTLVPRYGACQTSNGYRLRERYRENALSVHQCVKT